MIPLKRLKKTEKFEGRGKESDAPMLHPDHRRPVSRREFLGQGFITGAAYVMAPSILSLLGASKAARAECATIGTSGTNVPFIGIDLGGGANIAGSNVMVGTNGQLDPLTEGGYERLGLPLDMTPLNSQINALDTDMNLAFHFDSALMRGIKDKASLVTLAKVDGVIVPSRSSNDTQNNPLNPIYGIHRAGASGALLDLIGSRSSDSGGRSIAPEAMIVPEFRPTKIDRPSDVTGLVDTGKLSQLLGAQGAGQVADAIEAISNLKVEQINEDQTVKDIVNCAYEQSNDLITLFGSPDALDPLQDPIIFHEDAGNPVPSIFTAADFDESEFRKTASVMKLVCEGHAGAGTIEFGGYDYHGGTRSRGELKDFTAGQAIGAILEYAERNPNVNELMIYLFSDGSLSSDGQIDNSADGRGKGAWQSDNSSTASAVLLVYRKSAKPDLLPNFATRRQIGFFRDTGSVETDATVVANNPEALAQLVILNYMALHGQTAGDFNSLFPGNALLGDAASLIAFAPL